MLIVCPGNMSHCGPGKDLILCLENYLGNMASPCHSSTDLTVTDSRLAKDEPLDSNAAAEDRSGCRHGHESQEKQSSELSLTTDGTRRGQAMSAEGTEKRSLSVPFSQQRSLFIT